MSKESKFEKYLVEEQELKEQKEHLDESLVAVDLSNKKAEEFLDELGLNSQNLNPEDVKKKLVIYFKNNDVKDKAQFLANVGFSKITPNDINLLDNLILHASVPTGGNADMFGGPKARQSR